MERTCNISFLVQYKLVNYFDGILFQIFYQFPSGHNHQCFESILLRLGNLLQSAGFNCCNTLT